MNAPESIGLYLDGLERAVEELEGWQRNPIHDYLREHGESYEYAPYDEERYGPKGEAGWCFRNAYELALAHDNLTYVEGLALSIYPMDHAWCIDEDGKVVDPTWKDGTEYFGVAFDTEEVCEALVTYGVWGHLPNILECHEVPAL